jgi:uncharacterized alpha-E superfamily protein
MSDLMLSRVADHLYWMSRYLERAEHIARVLLVKLTMGLDDVPDEAHWQLLLDSLLVSPPEGMPLDAYHITQLLTFDPENKEAILNCLNLARENARNVREQISSEMWEHLNELYLQTREGDIRHYWLDGIYPFLRSIRDGVVFFQGVTDSTMNHGEGWQFIEVGRYIERAKGLSTLLDSHLPTLPMARQGSIDHYLQWVGLLKCATAFEAYCRLHTADVQPARAIEFLLLNAEFPHAIGFSVDRLQAALHTISEMAEKRKGIRANRLVGKLRAALDFGQIDEILAADLHHYLLDIQAQCAEIHSAVHDTYVAYPIESALNQ